MHTAQMIQEPGHELIIHSKGAAEEYRVASEYVSNNGINGDDAAENATCLALQSNARVRESLGMFVRNSSQHAIRRTLFFERKMSRLESNIAIPTRFYWVCSRILYFQVAN